MTRFVWAEKAHVQEIWALVQSTIRAVYPRCYPMEAVEFFCRHHSLERIAEDVEGGGVGVLMHNGQLVGTGACRAEHIARVYVLPQAQGRGYGSLIMERMEQEIAQTYAAAELDASLPALRFYAHRGYAVVRRETIALESGKMLAYEVMRKRLT